MKFAKKKFSFYAFFLSIVIFSLQRCIVSSQSTPEEYSAHVELDNPLIADTYGISQGVPEDQHIYSKASLVFNWAADEADYYRVLVSSARMEVEDESVANSEALVASWQTGQEGNPGYVTGDQLYSVVDGELQQEIFLWPVGTYYWAVLGFNEYGDLTHSSEQWKFYIK